MAFDISNTRVSVGVFESERLHTAFSMATDQRRTPDEYGALLLALMREHQVGRSDIDGAVIGSVVPPVTEALSQLCHRSLEVTPLCVGAGTRTGIRVATHHPREVGTDRIVNAVAAHRLFGGPAIVVDFSTATSFDVVADDGAYLGSVIAPGLGLSADALFERGALRLEKGDRRGARADFVKVRQLEQNSPLAEAAGQVLEQLDVKKD